jgi:hypothetical protein
MGIGLVNAPMIKSVQLASYVGRILMILSLAMRRFASNATR